MSQSTWLRRLLQQSRLRPVITRYHHRGLRENDVILGAYPKSGMTWLRNLLAAYFLESVDGWMDDIRKVSTSVGTHHGLSSYLPSGGRLINTHESYRPEYRRAILLLRDGRDVAVSEYKFWRERYQDREFQNVTFSEFLKMFLNGKTNGYSPWSSHVKSWIDAPIRSAGAMHVLHYEMLRANTSAELARLLSFLNIQPDAERVAAAVEKSSIDRMRKAESNRRKSTVKAYFARSGSVGGWAEVFSASDEAAFDRLAGESQRCVNALARPESGLDADQNGKQDL